MKNSKSYIYLMNAHIKHEKMTLNDTIDIETDTVQHEHEGKVPAV